MNAWLKNANTKKCIKNKKCKLYLSLAINHESLKKALKKVAKNHKCWWEKSINEVNIAELRKDIIKKKTSQVKTPCKTYAINLFSNVYTNMPASDKPEDYKLIRFIIKYYFNE